MRIAADRFYDGTKLYDIRLLSTLGFDDKQVDLVRETEGVVAAMPAKSTDVMALLDGEQYAIRINSFDHESAKTSTCEDGCEVVSENDSYLNRLVLSEGRWPSKAGECVLSADRVMVSPVRMGDKVEVLYGANDLDGVLEQDSFTVVGLIHSSSYVSAVTQGTTTLGSGEIQQFMYTTDESFSVDCPYSEIFISVKGAIDEFSGSSEYEEVVNRVKARLEDASDALAQSRLDVIKGEAQSEIDDAQKEYDEQKQDAEQKLSDAEAELADARQKLDDSEWQLASGEQQLQQGRDELASQRNRVQSELNNAKKKLDATQKQLDEAQAALDAARADVDAWPDTRAELQAQRAQAEGGIAQAQEALDAIDEVVTALDSIGEVPIPEDGEEWTDEQKAAAAAIEQARAPLEAQLQQLQAAAPEAQATIAQLESAIAQIDAGIEEGDEKIAEYNKRKDEVAAGYEQLSQGWNEYYSQERNAQKQLDAAQSEIDASAIQLQDARSQLEQGRIDYDEGMREYQENKDKADIELGDAASALAAARADVDELEAPDIYVLDRTKNYGVSSVKADSERIDNIAAVFPFIFFLVAALVALTTMTRMVEEDRVLIGTFKALGYSKARITSKYLIYAGIASIAGAIIGICILSQVLPAVIMRAYAIIYNIPALNLPLPVDMPRALAAAGMGAGVTLLATWLAMANTLREQPASLMLPRAPKAGKRILLERIKPIWEHLSFSWKVTCRNLFRYKKRLFMTVIGIAGCTALLLTGLGLHDAIWDIIDKHFGATVRYNVVVRLDDDASEQQRATTLALVQEEGKDSAHGWAADINRQVGSSAHDPMGTTLTVPEDASTFTKLVDMKDRKTQAKVHFDEDSVVLTEKLARTLGVGIGDEFDIYEQDDIGNAIGTPVSFTVTDIAEYYVGNAVFIGKNAFTQATAEEPSFTSLYATCTENEDDRKELSADLHEKDYVQTVAYNDETIDSYRTMLQSVNMIVVVLVVAAALLAFIVLYNLTNINITERRREIASLKVLGFTRREVDAYIYREIVLLTLFGALLGLVLGVFMESFVVVTAEVDYVMFGRDIHLPSFIYAFALTVGFSLFVMLAMRVKLKRIDMVESLKSVD